MFLSPFVIRLRSSDPSLWVNILLLSGGFMLVCLWYRRWQDLRIPFPRVGVTPVTFEMTLADEPSVKGSFQSFSYRNLQVSFAGGPRLHYGDHLKVTGLLQAGSPFLSKAKVEVTKNQGYTGFKAKLLSFRGLLSRKIGVLFPEPEAALLKGMLLGIKVGLPDSFADDLRRTGTLHVVVASGFNISLLAKFLTKISRFLGRTLSLMVTITGLLLYTLLTGAEPPVMRSFLMGVLVCYGDYLGRPSSLLRLLLVAAVVMVMVNPLLVEDLSFQLSFLATLALLTIAPFLKGIIKYRYLEDFWSSLSAQALVWPLVAYRFKSVSFWSPLTNLSLLWSVEPAMLLGFLSMVTPSFLRPLLFLTVSLALIPLTYFVKAASTLSSLPGSLLFVELSRTWLVLYYATVFGLGLFIFLFKPSFRRFGSAASESKE